MEEPQSLHSSFYAGNNGNAGGSEQGRRLSLNAATSSSVLPPPPTTSSSEHFRSSNGDFSPHFLVAAAAASAQAEAARSASRPSLVHASSSISPQPPLPYLAQETPFPLELGSRSINPSHEASSNHKGKSREDPETLGRVRCCWAILSTRSERLDFLYVDPTFSQHLGSEADRINGTSFFDYIHSEEEERTRVDMKNIIQSRTLFGSVTRCRYSTLSHIKAILKTGASVRAEAEDFLPVDIVVNWIGEDMALCFFHAILDESAQDNNELDKTDWSNWCGMKDSSVGQKECQSMWQSIHSHRSLSPSSTGPQYVFQVLSAVPPSQQANASVLDVLFSWPPPRLFAAPTSDAVSASSINFADGSYFLDDFARLAQGVDQLTMKEMSDANTSCTRRFRAKHTLTTEGMIRSVESVLIPYGSIVLACFSVTYAQALPGSSAPLAISRRASVEVPLSTLNGPSVTTEKDNLSHNRNGSAAPSTSSSLASLANASMSAAANGNEERDGLQALLSKAGGDGSDASRGGGGGSVATLAAVAAAASAQSKKCASCGASNSPEWRKGPDGTKSLCNACGLRFSRNISRAKKKEERAQLAAEVAANGGIVPPHIKKKLGEEKKKVKKPRIGKKEDYISSVAPAAADQMIQDKAGVSQV